MKKKLLVTGHRKVDEEVLTPHLIRALSKCRDEMEFDTMICGMAWGTDIIAAEIALRHGYNVIGVEPFPYYRTKWSDDWNARYWDCFAEPNYSQYIYMHNTRDKAIKDLYLHRDEFMVNMNPNAVLAVMSDPNSGTGYTVKKAKEAGIDPVWILKEH